MNHATPKAPINEQTHPASPHHREPTTGEGSRTRESSDRSLTSPAANALDWKICALGSSFDLDEVLAAAPATEILPELDALVPPNPNASPKPIRRVDQPHSGLTLLELVVVLMILVALAGVVVPLVSDSVVDSLDTGTRASLTALRDVVSTYWIDSGSSKKLPRPEAASITAGRADHPQLIFLFVNPTTLDDNNPMTSDTEFTFNAAYRVGWRGPYLRQATGRFPNPVDIVESSPLPLGSKPTYAEAGFFPANRYGEPGDSVIVDPWGNPIVIQNPGATAGVQDVRLVSAGPNGVLSTDPTVMTSLLGSTGDDIYVAFTLR